MMGDSLIMGTKEKAIAHRIEQMPYRDVCARLYGVDHHCAKAKSRRLGGYTQEFCNIIYQFGPGADS